LDNLEVVPQEGLDNLKVVPQDGLDNLEVVPQEGLDKVVEGKDKQQETIGCKVVDIHPDLHVGWDEVALDIVQEN
jgi:hypothetical protein